MDKKQIIIIAVTVIAVAIRLYMKYVKKNDNKIASGTLPGGTSFPSSNKDEDYEPYSKK